MTKTDELLQAFAENQHPENFDYAAQSLYNLNQRQLQKQCLSDLNALLDKLNEGMMTKETLKEKLLSMRYSEHIAKSLSKEGKEFNDIRDLLKSKDWTIESNNQ